MTAQTLVAIDPNALDVLAREIARLHARLDAVEIQPKPEWITVKDYAEEVGKTPRTIRNWINKGIIETRAEGEITLVRLTRGA